MTKEIQMNWLDGMAFQSELDGHTLVIDADDSVGGTNRGPRPKAFCSSRLPAARQWMSFLSSRKCANR
jgi:hypothetical protein